MRYKLIIFDWDGTLMDSIDKIVCCMQIAAKYAQLSVPSKKILRNTIGLSLEHTFLTLFSEGTQTQQSIFIKVYREQYTQKNKMQTPLYPGIKAYLHTLHAQGYQLAIATGKSRQGLEYQLESLQIKNLFKCVYCAEDSASKPDPLMLNNILKDLNCDISQALMIGDASFDLQMAHNAGMDCLAVSYGAQQTETLMKFKPLTILNSLPKQLGKYI